MELHAAYTEGAQGQKRAQGQVRKKAATGDNAGNPFGRHNYDFKSSCIRGLGLQPRPIKTSIDFDLM